MQCLGLQFRQNTSEKVKTYFNSLHREFKVNMHIYKSSTIGLYDGFLYNNLPIYKHILYCR